MRTHCSKLCFFTFTKSYVQTLYFFGFKWRMTTRAKKHTKKHVLTSHSSLQKMSDYQSKRYPGDITKSNIWKHSSQYLFSCEYRYLCQFSCGILKMVGPKMQDFCPKINILKGNVFKTILQLIMVCQKVLKLYFQSQFSMSKIDGIFSKKII